MMKSGSRIGYRGCERGNDALLLIRAEPVEQWKEEAAVAHRLAMRQVALRRHATVTSNAIGLVFHIVDDRLWLQLLINMRDLLYDDGLVMVGNQFGMITQKVQFYSTDEFENLEDMRKSLAGGKVHIIKSIGSLRRCGKTA